MQLKCVYMVDTFSIMYNNEGSVILKQIVKFIKYKQVTIIFIFFNCVIFTYNR